MSSRRGFTSEGSRDGEVRDTCPRSLGRLGSLGMTIGRRGRRIRHMPLADHVRDLDHLEELLSEPTHGAIDMMGRLEGDVLLLGVGGKMGPSLARMARRASDAAGVKRRVIGVSRFSSPQLPRQLNAWGIETMTA